MMFDIWGFLLQTLTASGVAVLVLVVKALFKDKLPPKWHFAVWGVLGMMILIPAGLKGRYTLFHWQLVIESIKILVGDYSFTRLLFPIPVLTAIPRTLGQWLFAGYSLGVLVHLIKYLVSYIRLRLVLRGGTAPKDDVIDRIGQLAAAHKIKVCSVIAVAGLPSAFVFGIIRPVLVIPADKEPDDKVIVHELMHLKYGDTRWSMVICLLRCLHWCNPLIVFCANQALNDMEARCDQHVLEQLEGEQRREYGKILLSMANDRFSKTPGSTCINNGGKNIRARIEAIARFKQYPAGMGLVSVCGIIILAVSLAAGVRVSAVHEPNGNSVYLPLASARSTPCTTPAGAFDTYAKAVLDQNGFYRVMCAPEAMQEEIIKEVLKKEKTGIFPSWDCGLEQWPDSQSGYYIYNLKQRNKTTYEGLLVVKVNYPPNGQPGEAGKMYLAVQNLRVKKENGRWVAIGLENFRSVEALNQSLEWGCMELPGVLYTGVVDDFRVEVNMQTVHTVENTAQSTDNLLWSNAYYDTTPKPNTHFTRAVKTQSNGVTHLGTQEQRDSIELIGLSVAPVYPNEKRPVQLPYADGTEFGGGDNAGRSWCSRRTDPGWGPYIKLGGGGSGTFDPEQAVVLPGFYVAELHVKGEAAQQIDLYPQEAAQ